MKIIILKGGGLGIRLMEEVEAGTKPTVEIGEKSIL